MYLSMCLSASFFMFLLLGRRTNTSYTNYFHFYLRVCVGRYLSYSYAEGNKLPLSMCIEMSLSPFPSPPDDGVPIKSDEERIFFSYQFTRSS